ncbi:MAG: pectin acetylesterase-family hydrolase [Pseudomonadota bacterium]
MKTLSSYLFAKRLLALSLAAPLLGHAAVEYNKWVAVEAPASTGAACGNGSLYHYFVNRAPNTKKTLVYFEGGGACWNQTACLGKGKFSEVATNPEGVPSNYLSQLNLAAFGMISPMIWRDSILTKTVTQSWNIVYVPYCTGDAHAGNAVNVYKDVDATKPLTYFHRGHTNAKEVARWVSQNVPTDELLVSGFSAGGVGASANYIVMRNAINPAKSSLLSDAGPLFPTPQSGARDKYPSLPLHNQIRSSWGFDRPEGILTEGLAQYPGAEAIRTNIGALNGELAKIFPQDRFGFTNMQQDGVFSTFSYRLFYPEIASISDTKKREAAYNQLWMKDINNLTGALQQSPNVGYYIPFFRPLIKSHTLTTLDYAGTAIEDAGYKSVETFIQNTLDRSAKPIRAVEKDHFWDFLRPVDGIQWLVYLVQDLFV